VKKREGRQKGLKRGKVSPVKDPLSRGRLAVSRGLNPSEPLRMHSCGTQAKHPAHNTSAGGENTEQGQQCMSCKQPLRTNPSGSLCHSAVERIIVSRTPFRQEGKLNGSTVKRSEGISIAEADGALRSFLAACFPSSERNQQRSEKGPLFSIYCRLQKRRNRVPLPGESAETFH